MKLQQQEKLRSQKLAFYYRNRKKLNKYAREHYQKNRVSILAQDKKRRRNIMEEIFNLLGKKCASCGYNDVRALQIDHVKGGGYAHRKSVGLSSYYTDILKRAKEDENLFQLLCANCNFIRGIELGFRKTIWN